ncbi:MAG: DUF1684 domain-containing protein [Clostridia bacterium]|nr:DUF1684 domain-containing protein [Clostridia bacterium]
MKNHILIIALLLVSFFANTQDKTEQYIRESVMAQEALNAQYANPEETPLLPDDLAKFESLDFFPVNPDLIFEVTIRRTPQAIPFMMKRTKDEVKYVKYGEVSFAYQGKTYTLSVYQNLDLIARNPEYENDLFLPFTDLTNGETTYGGGRYLDLEKSAGNPIVLNFNKAYNPLCHYNKKYSCPIPPAENDLPIPVEAGVKKFH